MSDGAIRRLEQAYQRSGTEDALRAYLRALQRARRLDMATLEVAAYCGDSVANDLLEEEGGWRAHPRVHHASAFLRDLPGGREVQARVGAQVAQQMVAEESSARVELRECAAAYARWLDEPSEDTAQGVRQGRARLAGELLERYEGDLHLWAQIPVGGGQDLILELVCWSLGGLIDPSEQVDWEELAGGVSFAQERAGLDDAAIVEVVRRGLVPWVYRRTGQPLVQTRWPFYPAAMTPAAAEAVLAAWVEPLDHARANAVIEACMVARGWTVSKSTLTAPCRTQRFRRLKTVLKLQYGPPGVWEGDQLFTVSPPKYLTIAAVLRAQALRVVG